MTKQPDVETASSRYGTRFKGQTGEWLLQVQEQHLFSLLAPWQGASILDVGGGHGQYTKRLVQAGYAVTVLGSAPEADGQVRTLVASGECEYLVGDLLDLPVADNSFDIVISFRLLPHLEDWRGFIGEAARVARNAVILDFPVLHSFNIFYPLLFWLKRACEGNTTRTFQVFKEKEVVEEFKKVGFFPSSRRPEYFFPMVIHRLLHAPSVSMSIEKACSSATLTRRFGSPVVLRVEAKPEKTPDTHASQADRSQCSR